MSTTSGLGEASGEGVLESGRAQLVKDQIDLSQCETCVGLCIWPLEITELQE